MLRLVTDAEVLLVLDSSRCGRWEIFTLGVRCGGRVLPVGWQVLPYPWPKGQYTPTTLTLLDRVLGCWPPERAVHLVADRGFPSKALVRRLDEWRRWRRLGYTLRLTIGAWVTLADGRTVRLADLVGNPSAGRWQTWAAHYPGCPDGPDADPAGGRDAGCRSGRATSAGRPTRRGARPAPSGGRPI